MDSMKLFTSIPSLRASSLGPRISLVILSCNRLLFTYGSVLRILCFYSEITGFFLKQKQLKVSYEIFLSSRSFGFHIPTSLEGERVIIFASILSLFLLHRKGNAQILSYSLFKEEKMSQLNLVFLSFISAE